MAPLELHGGPHRCPFPSPKVQPVPPIQQGKILAVRQLQSESEGLFLARLLAEPEYERDVAWALVGFDSLAAYEAYRARLKADHDGQEDAEWTARKRLILREERNFVEMVDGTFNLPPT